MDAETVFKMFHEIRSDGYYAADVVEPLTEEIRESSLINPQDKVLLEKALNDIGHGNSRVGILDEVLSKYKGFRHKKAKYVIDMLEGKH